MRAAIAAILALAAAAAPASAQGVLYQWPASATTIAPLANCPVRVAGAYAAMVGEATPRVVVQALNGDAQRARELRFHITYVSANGGMRREGHFGPFRLAAGQVQEVRTLALPPGMPTGSLLTIRLTGCLQA